ncbi:methionyl-tRNA synthetase [Isosphaera pallida ATCC 43644]|uniref:Methionine--tRNA ligase n=1 Tax=Isosphaera pallida (strain ATCC 43644 / DSM 9630 / IS1B) TaxID=575540 RepID=E8QZY3_ISOPI|nr:methionine--tRNA ligase [Isosphaera pallida]ADV63274.1 methionyl-tRNA synthetase [Isosphaera pallida ATCC 43644]
MREESWFYITTAIDYPNSRPHIGTAFEKIGADIQARYQRLRGKRVRFQMGNDENTIKVSQRAAQLGLEPKPYVDDMARQFQEVWRALDLSYDDFIQTSEPRHAAGCRRFIQQVFDNGDIYKKSYVGLYCDGCEAFKTDKEVAEGNGRCPLHPNQELRRVEEENYFFKLSKYADALLDFYRSHPDFIQPESRRNEIVNFVEAGLQDLSISRKGFTWGIKVPFDEEQTIYVWFDALLNYLTAIGYGDADDPDRWRAWWPADVHVIGKDITRFHCVIWPAMLMSAGIEPPRRVFGHGFVYVKGAKASKSQGNVVDPHELTQRFGSDAVRYYFARECPFGGDGNYAEERFIDLYNADLANNLGNLYSRSLSMCVKYFDGVLEEIGDVDPTAWRAGVDWPRFVAEIGELIESFQTNVALQRIWLEGLDLVNQYIQATQPFRLVKTDPQATKVVMVNLAEALRALAVLIAPVLPRTARTFYESFDFGAQRPWETIRWEDAAVAQIVPRRRVTATLVNGKPAPLFPKIEVEAQPVVG